MRGACWAELAVRDRINLGSSSHLQRQQFPGIREHQRHLLADCFVPMLSGRERLGVSWCIARGRTATVLQFEFRSNAQEYLAISIDWAGDGCHRVWFPIWLGLEKQPLRISQILRAFPRSRNPKRGRRRYIGRCNSTAGHFVIRSRATARKVTRSPRRRASTLSHSSYGIKLRISGCRWSAPTLR